MIVFARNYQSSERKAMLIKTVLNKIEYFNSFFFGKSEFASINGHEALVIDIKLRSSS